MWRGRKARRDADEKATRILTIPIASDIRYSQLEGVVTVQATLFIGQKFPRCNDGNKTTLDLVGSIYKLTEHLIGVQRGGSRVIKATIRIRSEEHTSELQS